LEASHSRRLPDQKPLPLREMWQREEAQPTQPNQTKRGIIRTRERRKKMLIAAFVISIVALIVGLIALADK